MEKTLQASVICAVIQCDFQRPQFPGLVASVPQIAFISRAEGKLAVPEEEIKVMCCNIFPLMRAQTHRSLSPQKTSHVLD